MPLAYVAGICNRLLSRHLFLTNTVTAASLMAAGDIIQQKIEIRQGQTKDTTWKTERTARMSTIGLALGPLTHVWYKYLDRYYPGTKMKTIAKKIIADQVIASPVLSLVFFFGMGALEGKPTQATAVEFQKKFPFYYTMDWIVWPPAQVINFVFLPPRLRVIYVSVVILFWDMFMSFVKHSESEDMSISSVIDRLFSKESQSKED